MALFFQVEYFNNKKIVDLVEAQHKGVLAILDEACLNVGKVTDKVSSSRPLTPSSDCYLLDAAYQLHAGHMLVTWHVNGINLPNA